MDIMKNKKLIFNVALAKVEELKLDKYHTYFLAEMVVRKLRHPEEKMDKIASKVMKEMKKNYPKKNLVEVSAAKCLNQLEVALNDSDAVPAEWLSGQTVSHVVKKLVQIVFDELDEQ